ncbi:MAG: non-canonical purine NTP pyrophosphatase [Pedosphaera sp.]|nr:non-canonical purine NTP pyrophosphatase [Pedosphaera sp.]
MNILISSRNAHKCAEISALLPGEIRWLTLRDFPAAPEVIEDADSFIGNAIKKAVQLAHWIRSNPPAFELLSGQKNETPYFVLADDSGLEVDALHGAPGVHSARFAGLESGLAGNSSDAANNAKLLSLLRDIPREMRTARFRCVIALAPVLLPPLENRSPGCYPTEIELQAELFDGTCEGRIGFAPSGKEGFGYDPLFIPENFEQTFAELGAETKSDISHRAKALLKLRQRLIV